MEAIKYKAVVRVDSEGKQVEVQEFDIPEPGPGQVLIRVESAPINPSDTIHLGGLYGDLKRIKAGPIRVGFEGAGQIVKLGEGSPEALLNSKCGFSSDVHSPTYIGSWGQYFIGEVKGICPFPEHVEYNVIASYAVNPLTVCGFVDVAQKNGHKAIIHGAAASALGKQLVRFAKTQDVKVINIVRRQEQADMLNEIGADVILDSSKDTFWDDLKNAIAEHQPTALFDPISGDLPSKILEAMPNKSTLYNYGALDAKPLRISPLALIMAQKTITGFWLGPWMATLTPDETKTTFGHVVGDLATGGKIFGTKVVKEYPLSGFGEAVAECGKVASQGKIIIKPQL